jgi:hypothetical protein
MRDLWPDDIKSQEVISPEEILKHQASQLEARTNGLLAGHVVRHAGEDRVVIGFEVEAPRADTRARLFEVQHRLEFEYPAAIVGPDIRLPEFLKERVYQSPPLRTAARDLMEPGRWVENPWIASSPSEFSEKVEALLARPSLKGIVLSLLSRANQQEAASGEEEAGS